jgi:hypothetical protein
VTHRTLGIDSKIFMTPLYSPASKRHCITFLVVDFIGWRERSMRGGWVWERGEQEKEEEWGEEVGREGRKEGEGRRGVVERRKGERGIGGKERKVRRRVGEVRKTDSQRSFQQQTQHRNITEMVELPEFLSLLAP